MSNILQVRGFEIIDSRGNPTVEAAEVVLSDGARWLRGRAVGRLHRLARGVELRDGDKKRYLGKGVLKAVANVNGELKAALLGQDVRRTRRRSMPA
jgi:enolase